jgi:ligand-binding sensor domain-containing protein
MRKTVLFASLFLPLMVPGLSGVQARQNKGDVVNYANFDYINAIATSQRYVYFATTNGIIVYNKLDNRWADPLTGADGLDVENVRRIWVDRFDQTLCAATDAGLYQYDSLVGEWSSIPELPSIESDDRHINMPPIMTAPMGFNYMPGGNLADRFGRAFPIHDIVDDGSGGIWIGTWGYGPARADNIASPIKLLPFGLLQNPTFTLTKDSSRVWMAGPILGSYRTGITEFDRDANSFSYIESGANMDFPQTDVNCVQSDSTSLYVGTAVGLFVFDRTNFQMTSHRDQNRGLLDERVTSLKKVGDSLYVGTAAGLVVLGPSLDSVGYIAPDQFLNKIIYDLDVVDGYLWIASEVGAYRLSLTGGKLQRFQDPDQVLFSRVYTVRHFGRSLWLASEAGAVRINLDDGTTKPYRNEYRTFDSRALAANDKVLILSSDRGFTLTYLDHKNPRSREFSVEDGLPSTHVFSLLMDGDYLWVGTDQGVCLFWWNNPFRID